MNKELNNLLLLLEQVNNKCDLILNSLNACELKPINQLQLEFSNSTQNKLSDKEYNYQNLVWVNEDLSNDEYINEINKLNESTSFNNKPS